MAKLVSGIPWWKYVGNIVLVLVIVSQIVSVESSSSGDNDTGSAIGSEEVLIQELSSMTKDPQDAIESPSENQGSEFPDDIGHVANFEEKLRSKLIQFNETLNKIQTVVAIITESEKMEQNFKKIESQFESKLQVYETQIINATVNYINTQEPTEAYKEFKRLYSNRSSFQKIIEQAWKFNSNVIDNILPFIAEFPSCETRAPLYKTLFDFMNKNIILSPNISLYNQTVYKFWIEMQSCSNHLENINKQLSIYRDNITSKWADDIRNGRQEEIKKIQFFINQTLKNEDSVDITLSDIVTRAYDDKVENIGKTVEFIHGLTNMNHVFKGNETLFNAMIKNGHNI